MEESSECTSIVNSAENRENLCEAPDGKPLFSAHYSIYTVTINELKTFLRVECTGKTKWCNEQNLSGTNGPGRQLP
jgi:hypothetical protein